MSLCDDIMFQICDNLDFEDWKSFRSCNNTTKAIADRRMNPVWQFIIPKLDWETWVSFKRCSKISHTLCEKKVPRVSGQSQDLIYQDIQFLFHFLKKGNDFQLDKNHENAPMIQMLTTIHDGNLMVVKTPQEMESFQRAVDVYNAYNGTSLSIKVNEDQFAEAC